MDDFENSTLRGEITGSGTNYSGLRSISHMKSGNYSLKLTTGDLEDDYAAIRYYLQNVALKKIGVEYSFALGSCIKRIENLITLFNGTHYHWVHTLYYPQDEILRIIKKDGSEQTIANVKLFAKDNLFNSWKMTFDYDTKRWIAVYLNDVKYDVSEYEMPSGDSTQASYIHHQIKIVNNSANNHHAYIDNVILTQMEPKT